MSGQSPYVPKATFAPRWLVCLTCLLGLSLLPILVIGLTVGRAPSEALCASPLLAIIFESCMRRLITGEDEPRLFDFILKAAKHFKRQRKD
jgi:hypothetical protein